MKIIDYIVIGSGCSGAMAAQTLVEAGKSVTMLDVGVQNDASDDPVPVGKDYLTLRRTDPEQYRYFLGENIEGVTWGDIGKGAQITPSRKHMHKHVESHIPVKSETFFPLESLGYGGLGIGWGVQCWEYSEADMKAAGLDPKTMAAAYETVSKRIGVSGVRDEASKYTLGTLKHFQESPDMDRNHKSIYSRYLQKKAAFHKKGLHMGRTPLALLTKDHNGRRAYAYRDMDFYTDQDQSAWRPWITIDSLRKTSNFDYAGGLLVTSFDEKKDYVEITCHEVATGEEKLFRCRKLILGSGALGTARIVLRSLNAYNQHLPLLCNPYTYIPCLQPAMMGKGAEPKKMGFAQLSLFLDENKDNFNTSVSSLYSYQSLMMFRVIKQIPFLNFIDARLLMRYMMTGLVIMGVHHPDSVDAQKYIRLVADKKSPTGDRVDMHYVLQPGVKKELLRREKKMLAAMRKAGLFALKRINPGYGSSVHYAGTLPYSKENKPFTLHPDGRLHGTKSVYVADSSGFNYLPARGLTFTLLANAHRVAEEVLKSEK